MNHVLAEAAKVAGYTVHIEQVVPELAEIDCRGRVKEARIDVECFGHAYAPDLLLDGTIRHPAAKCSVVAASKTAGHAAEDGTIAKCKRYPPKLGKCVHGCSMETWGYFSACLDDVLVTFAGLGSRRQFDRGVQPTKWLQKWR